MLTVFIGVCAFVVIGAALSEGEIAVVVFAVIALVVLIAMAADDRKDTKAIFNFRDYWADGGDDRRRRR